MALKSSMTDIASTPAGSSILWASSFSFILHGQVHENIAYPVPGIRICILAVHFGEREKHFLQRFCQLVLDLGSGSSGKDAGYKSLFYLERRELILVYKEKPYDAYGYKRQDDNVYQAFMGYEAPDYICRIPLHHSNILTFIPVHTFCTPSVITLSPIERPSEIITPFPEKPSGVT